MLHAGLQLGPDYPPLVSSSVDCKQNRGMRQRIFVLQFYDCAKRARIL